MRPILEAVGQSVAKSAIPTAAGEGAEDGLELESGAWGDGPRRVFCRIAGPESLALMARRESAGDTVGDGRSELPLLKKMGRVSLAKKLRKVLSSSCSSLRTLFVEVESDNSIAVTPAGTLPDGDAMNPPTAVDSNAERNTIEGLALSLLGSIEELQKESTAAVAKRKAFSDFMKGMKETGLSHLTLISKKFPKDFIELFKQSPWSSWSALSVTKALLESERTKEGGSLTKCSEYYYRNLALLQTLRTSIAAHSPDISGIEAQRALNFCEHLFGLLSEQREAMSATSESVTLLKTVYYLLDRESKQLSARVPSDNVLMSPLSQHSSGPSAESIFSEIRALHLSLRDSERVLCAFLQELKVDATPLREAMDKVIGSVELMESALTASLGLDISEMLGKASDELRRSMAERSLSSVVGRHAVVSLFAPTRNAFEELEMAAKECSPFASTIVSVLLSDFKRVEALLEAETSEVTEATGGMDGQCEEEKRFSRLFAARDNLVTCILHYAEALSKGQQVSETTDSAPQQEQTEEEETARASMEWPPILETHEQVKAALQETSGLEAVSSRSIAFVRALQEVAPLLTVQSAEGAVSSTLETLQDAKEMLSSYIEGIEGCIEISLELHRVSFNIVFAMFACLSSCFCYLRCVILCVLIKVYGLCVVLFLCI